MKHFYCDASSNKDHRYMVAGGFVLDAKMVGGVEHAIANIKGIVPNCGELKWSKYRGGQRTQIYYDVVDHMFGLIAQKRASLHVIVADFDGFNHKRHVNAENGTVNRLYYQLFIHSLCKHHGREDRMIAYPDYGNDSAEVIGFRNQICAAAYKTYRTIPNCLVDIRPRDSAGSCLMQATDIVIGAIAANLNGIIQKRKKIELSSYVLERSKHRDWAVSTPKHRDDLTVWSFKPSNEGAR